MRIVAGILLLIAGAIVPMGMLAWLNNRLSRPPRPTPSQIGLVLTLNGVLPAGLVLLGLGLMVPSLWETPWLKVVLLAVWLVASIALIALIGAGRTGPTGGKDAG